jgi:hypothetical protein
MVKPSQWRCNQEIRTPFTMLSWPISGSISVHGTDFLGYHALEKSSSLEINHYQIFPFESMIILTGK